MEFKELDIFSVFQESKKDEASNEDFFQKRQADGYIELEQNVQKKVKKGEEQNEQIESELIIEEVEQADDINIKNKNNQYNDSSRHKLKKYELKVEVEDCGCIHETIYSDGIEKKTLQKIKNPAKTYPFKLDPFQQKANECIENNESVLVAAHTSAGKTVVAQYAIASSLNKKQKVIYTSPIKALSNQKFRELSDQFKDVGLLTGDVSINQNATCLVMTTEILRSMLYRGSEITREVAWVIFDEVHYMRDKERGVVWEETIILLNPQVRFVFLSATIPNAREFAEWICTIKHQVCHVVYTEYRPTPLQHYIFPSGGQGIYLVVDENGQFREDNFQKALSVLGESVELVSSALDKKKGKKKRPTEGADLYKILKMIIDKHFDPVIIFSFSKKEVEGYAMAMLKFDLTTEEEKAKINQVYESACACLSEEDKQLPQIQHMLPILKKGIGIHHGGLLPIVKEVIEIMFQEGWLKVLFSTETFSMGLNMPARTVVFTSVRKFDGENFRWIQGGEYIQMSGRAGRRGIDDKGITILMVDEKMEPEVAKSMLKGQADPLNSSFHLGYHMLLNSMRIEDTDPEYIIRRSLHQFQRDKQIPEMKKKVQLLQDESQQFQVDDQETVKQIYNVQKKIQECKDMVRRIIANPETILPFLSIGRLVYIKKGEEDYGWGLSINFNKKRVNIKSKKTSSNEEDLYIVDVMLYIKQRNKNEEPKPQLDMDEIGEMEVIPLLLENIYEISSVRIMLPDDLTTKTNKTLVKETLKEIKKQFNNNLPILDPIKDMKVQNESLDKILEKQKKMLEMKQEYLKDKDFNKISSDLKQYENKLKYQKSINLLQNQLDESDKMVLDEDLRCMKRVLRRLGFINKEDIVERKGTLSCEISACDEIIITELMFSGLFNEMQPSEVAALLSCLVYDEGSQKEKEKVNIKNERLSGYFKELLETAKRVHKVYQESKINIDEQDYLANFRPQMMEVTYAWCNGATFAEICKLTETYEGSIIRCLRRLDELLKQLQDAAKTIGNQELEQKFSQANNNLKRGIVFAASLYL